MQAGPSSKGKRKVQEVQPTLIVQMKELQLQEEFHRGYETLQDHEDKDNKENEDNESEGIFEDAK